MNWGLLGFIKLQSGHLADVVPVTSGHMLSYWWVLDTQVGNGQSRCRLKDINRGNTSDAICAVIRLVSTFPVS